MMTTPPALLVLRDGAGAPPSPASLRGWHRLVQGMAEGPGTLSRRRRPGPLSQVWWKPGCVHAELTRPERWEPGTSAEDTQPLPAAFPASPRGSARAQSVPRGPTSPAPARAPPSAKPKSAGGLARRRAPGGVPARPAPPSLGAELASQSPPRFLHWGSCRRVPYPAARSPSRCHGGLQQVLDGAELLAGGGRLPAALPAPQAAPRARPARVRLAAAPPSRARERAPGARLALSSRARAARVSAERGQRSPSPAALGPVAAALWPDCGREEGAPCPRAPSPPPSCMPTFWVRPGFAISSPPRALRICSVDALGYVPGTSFGWTPE